MFPAVMLRLPATASAVGVGRRLVCEAGSFWELDAAEVYDARLITSELLTNAVKHAADVKADAIPGLPEGLNLVAVQARVHDSALFIEVWDPSEILPLPREEAADAEAGRGLPVVNRLSERWGAFPAEGGGKVVWAECAIGRPPPVSIGKPGVPLPRDVTRWDVPGTEGQPRMANTALLARILAPLSKL